MRGFKANPMKSNIPYFPAFKSELYRKVYPAQMTTQSLGRLRVRCTTTGDAPIANASVNITAPGDPNTIIEQLTTDGSGLTQTIELSAPPIDYSLAPSEPQP
jgi:hypothetical protein